MKGNLCKHFDEWFGECAYACPYCCDPFSSEACLDFQQMVQRNKKHPYEAKSLYEPSDQENFTPKNWNDVEKHISNAKTYAIYFLSDFELDNLQLPIYTIFNDGRIEAANKLKETGYKCRYVYTLRSYTIPGNKGTMFVAIA